MRKSIVWPCLLAASLALSGCGGGEPAEEPKPAAAKKKGAKEEVSPWAKEGPLGSEPAAAPKKKAKKRGKKGEEVAASPWAKTSPTPTAT